MTYQQHPSSLVFVAGLQQLAASLPATVPEMSAPDRQFCWDVARGEQRYRMIAVRRIVGLAQRSTNPAHRFAFSELVRSEELAGLGLAADVAAAFDGETQAVADAEMSQRSYERTRCRASRQLVIERLTAQLHWTRAALDAVHAHRS